MLFLIAAWLLALPLADANGLTDFLGGFAAGYAAHESGHIVSGSLLGIDSDIEIGKNNQPISISYRASGSNAATFNASGFAAQVIAGEYVVQSSNSNREFKKGLLTYNLLNSIFYALDYYAIGAVNFSDKAGPHGDLEGIEFHSGRRYADIVAISSIIISTWQYNRGLMPGGCDKFSFNFSLSAQEMRVIFGVRF